MFPFILLPRHQRRCRGLVSNIVSLKFFINSLGGYNSKKRTAKKSDCMIFRRHIGWPKTCYIVIGLQNHSHSHSFFISIEYIVCVHEKEGQGAQNQNKTAKLNRCPYSSSSSNSNKSAGTMLTKILPEMDLNQQLSNIRVVCVL